MSHITFWSVRTAAVAFAVAELLQQTLEPFSHSSYCFCTQTVALHLPTLNALNMQLARALLAQFCLLCRSQRAISPKRNTPSNECVVTLPLAVVYLTAVRNYCGEFDNFGSVMSVSEDLLCAFELLKVRAAACSAPQNSSLTLPLCFLSIDYANDRANLHPYRQPLDAAQLKKEMAKNRRRLSAAGAASDARSTV